MGQNNQNHPSIYCFNDAFLYVLHSLVSFPFAAKETKPFEQFYDSESAGIFKVSSWSNIILGAMVTKEKTPKLCFCSKANKQKQPSTNDNEKPVCTATCLMLLHKHNKDENVDLCR